MRTIYININKRSAIFLLSVFMCQNEHIQNRDDYITTKSELIQQKEQQK
jgi:hypothetical protein